MKQTLISLFKKLKESRMIAEKYISKTLKGIQFKKLSIAISFSAFIFQINTFYYSQSISCGYDQSLFLCNNGEPMACGGNVSGDLGDGTLTYQSTPVQINYLSGIIAVSAGGAHSIFLKNDGTVWACGNNWYGQLGDGTTTSKATPIQISSLSNIIKISAGGESYNAHSLFQKNDGTVWACGKNSWGQLGDGTTTNKTTPIQINTLSNIISISAGGYHSLFLKNDGTVWACGYNISGQLGDGTTTYKSIPIQISSISNITAVAAGGYHSLFLKNDSTVWACGDNSSGQLGDGTTTNKPIPIQIPSLSGIVAIDAGYDYSLFLKNDGTVWACGNAQNGKLGSGSNIGKVTTPVQISSLSGIISIAAGLEHSLFLKNDGSVWACGRNDVGQLGDGTTTNKSIPVQVTGLCSVSIEENLFENNISLYPNPFSNQTTLHSDKYLNNATINIYNAFGQMVKQINYISGQTFTLSNDNLPAGFYFLHLIENNKIIKTEKLVVSE
jgi:alpha-tubulin suppressor-like RCC1 family protein